MLLSEREIFHLEKQHPKLVLFKNDETLLETPEGKGNITEFLTIGGELQAKFNFIDRDYNYYSVFKSKEDETYHFGFVLTPTNFADELDEEEFDGIWKVATTEYTEEEFENKFERISLKINSY